MRLLEEDLNILDEKFPGAREFIRDAETRYITFRRLTNVRDRQLSGIDPEDPSLKEKWFADKIASEGISIPRTRPKKSK